MERQRLVMAGRWPIFIVVVGLAVGVPAAAWAWAGVQHIQINKLAGRNVPDEMADFRNFSRPMALPGIFPDLWKEADPHESPRHYFEPDRLPAGFDLTQLSPDLPTALNQLGLASEVIGIAPWAITDLMAKTTAAMRETNWVWAAQCAATIGHYVGDLHMPLHATRNFNGQETGQHGIHSRLESEMTKYFFDVASITPEPAVYLEDPFAAILEWAAHSGGLARSVLQADLRAKQAANGRLDTETYYHTLWDLTGDTINDQIARAITALSSVWYTTWVNAGKPPIPPAFDELPTFSVHSGVGIDPRTPGDRIDAHGGQPISRYNIIIWSVMAFIGLLVIGSSIHRGMQARRAAK